MPDDQKLTKKQRKGLAFREKKGKKKGRPDPLDLPEADSIDEPEAEAEVVEDVQHKEKVLGKRKRAEDSVDSKKSDKPTPSVDNTAKKPKTRRKLDAEEKKESVEEMGADENTPPTPSDSKPQKSRYILFIGNLKYTTTQSDIISHFSECAPTPPSVRLLTPKSSASKSNAKSKGCAFVEFSAPAALQKALVLHHSTLDGRKINVELTAGGGGKGDTRIGKVRERNRALGEERVKRDAKRKVRAKPQESAGADEDTANARHSSTSGSTPAPMKMRTWSVPEADDAPGTHRGGVKHSSGKAKKRGLKKGKAMRDMGTGVNAIPVG